MRIKLAASVLAAGLALSAAAAALAATPVSPGQLAGNPQGYDGMEVSLTAWVRVRGEIGWLQLCDAANTCLYVQRDAGYTGRNLRDQQDQRITIAGRFHAHAVVNNTDVRNVIELHG